MNNVAHDMSPLVDMTRGEASGAGPQRPSRSMSTCCRPATTPARPARTSRAGWAWPRPGKYREAWETLVRDNPMPAVHGRVCYHPCETACNRGELDSAVSIHAVERFLGDLAERARLADAGRQGQPSGKRVLVVGAGPSGLSAAYHLARLGHEVEIHEAGPLPGGMMHFGIPAYRLPRDDLMREIGRIEAMGVKIVLNHKVEDVLAEQDGGQVRRRRSSRSARRLGKHVDIPARDAVPGDSTRSRLLHDVGTGEAPHARPPGRRLRRRQHRDGRRPHRQAPGRRGSADRLSARPRAYAGARLRGRRGARAKASRSSGSPPSRRSTEPTSRSR